MIDAGRLRALLDRLTTELSHLERLAQLPDDELMSDGDRIAAVKYRFIVAIETCIDAGNHIIASEGLRAPSDYSDVFAVLAEAGFVPAELAPRLALMARFRNLLVHEYLAVEDNGWPRCCDRRSETSRPLRPPSAAWLGAGKSPSKTTDLRNLPRPPAKALSTARR